METPNREWTCAESNWGSLEENLLLQVYGLADEATAKAMRATCRHWLSVHRRSYSSARPCSFEAGPLVQHFSQLAALDLSGACNKLATREAEVLRLTALRKLTALTLHGFAHVNDDVLARLAAALPGLHELDISGCPITDVGLAGIAALKELENLSLRSCDRIRDAGMPHIAGLVQLTQLDLSYCQFVCEGVSELRGLSGLRRLSMQGTGYYQPACRWEDTLSRLGHLTFLDLSRTRQVSASVMVALGQLSGLRELYLEEVNSIAPDDLSSLQPLSQLQTLCLGHCLHATGNPGSLNLLTSLTSLDLSLWYRVTDDDLVLQCQSLRGLRELRLVCGHAVSGEGFVALAELSRLTSLAWSGGAGVEDGAYWFVGSALHLQSLSLMRADITHQGLAAIASASADSLTQLSLLELGAIFPDMGSFAWLAGLTRLKSLWIHHAPFSDSDVGVLNALTQLETLALEGCRRLSDEGMQGMQHLTGLARLEIRSCHVGDAGLAALAGMRKLRLLSVAGNPSITDAGVSELIPLAELRRLDIRGCNVTGSGLISLKSIFPYCSVVTTASHARDLPNSPFGLQHTLDDFRSRLRV